MGKGIPGLEQAYHILFLAALIFLAVMVVLCLIRAIIGPKIGPVPAMFSNWINQFLVLDIGT